MRETLENLPTAIGVEGVTVKGVDWGGMMSGHLRMAKGVDFAPVLQGLPNDHCQVPHWGYVIEGRIEVVYTDGATETVKAGDVYYWPPGHSVSFPEDTTYVEFSPAEEMVAVLGHVKGKMGIG